MNFFLSPEQEDLLNEWVDEQNKIAIEKQLNDENLSETVRNDLIERQKKCLDIPLHDEKAGYYSISFTPTGLGNRIYVHHHLNGESYKIQDIEELQQELGSILDNDKLQVKDEQQV